MTTSFFPMGSERPNFSIRRAHREDVPAIYSMLRESAIAQGCENDLCVDPFNLAEDGFGAEPRFQCLLAELDGTPVGLLLYFFTYCTWTSRKGFWLEDLYVAPAFRTKGIARTLMTEAAKIAIDAGCRYIEWTVLRKNSPALRFYESIGAVALSEWTLMRISAEELEQLSNEISA